MDGLERALESLRQRSIRASQELEKPSDACEICGGRGYILRRGENGELFSKECGCEIERQNRRRIERSGLSNLLARSTFESYRTVDEGQAAVKSLAMEYANANTCEWMFLGGNSGAGKTHLCTAVCGELMKRGLPVKWMQWRSDVPAIKAKVKDPVEYERAINPLKHIPVLYIDDFLKGAVTEADRNLAFDLLNYRYNQLDLITIISSEMSIDEVLEWDEAIGGRIFERCGHYVANIESVSNYRLKLADIS